MVTDGQDLSSGKRREDGEGRAWHPVLGRTRDNAVVSSSLAGVLVFVPDAGQVGDVLPGFLQA